VPFWPWIRDPGWKYPDPGWTSRKEQHWENIIIKDEIDTGTVLVVNDHAHTCQVVNAAYYKNTWREVQAQLVLESFIDRILESKLVIKNVWSSVLGTYMNPPYCRWVPVQVWKLIIHYFWTMTPAFHILVQDLTMWSQKPCFRHRYKRCLQLYW